MRDADPRRVAIYFQGGGGCWNSRNCGLEGQRTFKDSVGEDDRPWTREAATGIFDVSDRRNPLRNFSLILAPYCTADVHLGVRTSRFESADGKRLDVHYRGLANAQRVMDWVSGQYADVRVLFVTGGSAGAISSPVFAAQLARRYPRAQVIQLGDSAGGYRTARLPTQFSEWGAATALKLDPLFNDMNPASVNFEELYVRVARVRNLRLAQVNSLEDGIQRLMLREIGHEVTTLAPLLSGNLAELRRADPRLRTYTFQGTVHEILKRPEFYTTQSDGVALSAWVDDLLRGTARNVGDSLPPEPVPRLE
ncbi:MAG TPA: pectin acetylesterase-family hydrolase [Steroidobacteraceae bacterium]|nr:pectin acetylesterase-family hydrolase [Steroidobacteraceae bacterium]